MAVLDTQTELLELAVVSYRNSPRVVVSDVGEGPGYHRLKANKTPPAVSVIWQSKATLAMGRQTEALAFIKLIETDFVGVEFEYPKLAVQLSLEPTGRWRFKPEGLPEAVINSDFSGQVSGELEWLG